eukprot:4404794-Pleurochrysis_carterae.AAC.1
MNRERENAAAARRHSGVDGSDGENGDSDGGDGDGDGGDGSDGDSDGGDGDSDGGDEGGNDGGDDGDAESVGGDVDDGVGADIPISDKTVNQHQPSFTQAPVDQDTVDDPT